MIKLIPKFIRLYLAERLIDEVMEIDATDLAEVQSILAALIHKVLKV
jgi:hypothetical protein